VIVGLTPRIVRCGVRAVLLVAPLGIVACSGKDKPEPPPLAAAPVGARSGGPAPLPQCPGTGHWESCTVFDRLERAGLAPQRGDTIRFPFLTVAGQTWRIGKGTIHVFRYRDSVSRHTDWIALDSARALPKGDSLPAWSGTPTLLVNDNLLAILLSENGEQIERVSLALTAGPTPKPVAASPSH
jgi:hypothetical protein